MNCHLSLALEQIRTINIIAVTMPVNNCTLNPVSILLLPRNGHFVLFSLFAIAMLFEGHIHLNHVIWVMAGLIILTPSLFCFCGVLLVCTNFDCCFIYSKMTSVTECWQNCGKPVALTHKGSRKRKPSEKCLPDSNNDHLLNIKPKSKPKPKSKTKPI